MIEVTSRIDIYPARLGRELIAARLQRLRRVGYKLRKHMGGMFTLYQDNVFIAFQLRRYPRCMKLLNLYEQVHAWNLEIQTLLRVLLFCRKRNTCGDQRIVNYDLTWVIWSHLLYSPLHGENPTSQGICKPLINKTQGAVG